MYKVSDIESRLNREYDGKKIMYSKCDGCGCDKGQWADESNDQNGYELNAVYCTKCARGFMEAEDLRNTSF